MQNKMFSAMAGFCLMAGILSGCGNDSAQNAVAQNDVLSGKLTLAGSTSMEKMCAAMSESFMEKYPDVVVTVEYTGSGAGVESVASGSVDIGNASRSLKDGEKSKGLVENIVALDGIAVITDKENPVLDITTENLAKIYKGEITNWKDLGGKDEKIVVIGREAGSGTREAFEDLVKVKDSCKYAQELDSTGGILAKVASIPGAIGYVSLDVIDASVNAVKLNGVEVSEAQIKSGKYALHRPFVMATKGKVSEKSKVVQTWFNYIASQEGQAVIKKVGLISPNK